MISTELCPKLDDETWKRQINTEIVDLLASVNVTALLSCASALNKGKKCDFVPGKHVGANSMMGCANYHAPIVFEDGEKWLCRIPRQTFLGVPQDLVEHIVASEFATLKFLETTKVPAPKAFGLGLASDTGNAVGVSYLLIEFLPGEPFILQDPDPVVKERVFNGVAKILDELSKYPFPKAGSLLLDQKGEIAVSGVASNRWGDLDVHGPYNSASEYFEGTAKQYMNVIKDEQLFPGFSDEAEKVFSVLHRNSSRVSDASTTKTLPGFYLKHVDDKGDHLLIDAAGNITGIIDWQFARCVPAAEAFGPSLLTVDLNNFWSGKPSISPDDKALADALMNTGNEKLSSIMAGDELARKFMFGIGNSPTPEELKTMFHWLLVLFQDEGLAEKGTN